MQSCNLIGHVWLIPPLGGLTYSEGKQEELIEREEVGRGVEVGRREPVGSARAGLQRTRSGAEPTEQPASAGARVPPHQARLQGGSGE